MILDDISPCDPSGPSDLTPGLERCSSRSSALEAAVTLVIPVRDERPALPALVRSIERQSRSPDAVVFIDGGSADGTPQLLRSAINAHADWSVVEAGPATPGRARNVGFEVAETEWVALIDAGIELDPHWLERLVRVARSDTDVDIVYGHYEPAPAGHFSACAALAYVESPGCTDRGPVRSRSIASCLMKRSLWERVGGFPDLRAAEDRLFMRRVDELGARVAVAPEAMAWWDLQPDLVATFRRFRTYSRVNVEIGEQEGWHYGIARMYLAAAPFVVLAARRRRIWLLLPVAGALARVGRSIWSRREGRGVVWAANPARFVTVGVILLTVDLATFAGWVDAIVHRRRAG